jgi:hypothetical protein
MHPYYESEKDYTSEGYNLSFIIKLLRVWEHLCFPSAADRAAVERQLASKIIYNKIMAGERQPFTNLFNYF